MGKEAVAGDNLSINRTITWREGWGADWNGIYRSTSQSLGGHEARWAFRLIHAHVPDV